MYMYTHIVVIVYEQLINLIKKNKPPTCDKKYKDAWVPVQKP